MSHVGWVLTLKPAISIHNQVSNRKDFGKKLKNYTNLWELCSLCTLYLILSSSLNGHDEDGVLEHHNTTSDSNGSDGASKDAKVGHQVPTWLSDSTPDEFIVWLMQMLLNNVCQTGHWFSILLGVNY